MCVTVTLIPPESDLDLIFLHLLSCDIIVDDWEQMLNQCDSTHCASWSGGPEGETLFLDVFGEPPQDDNVDPGLPCRELQSRWQPLWPSTFPLRHPLELAVQVHRRPGKIWSGNSSVASSVQVKYVWNFLFWVLPFSFQGLSDGSQCPKSVTTGDGWLSFSWNFGTFLRAKRNLYSSTLFFVYS